MKTNIIIAAILAGLTATSAIAQTTAFDGAGAASDAVDNLQDDLEDDMDRDLSAFGTEGRDVGQYGSIALRYIATSNDGETSNDLGLGLRFGSFDGVNGIDYNASYAFGEENGTVTENSLLAGVDYRRNFNDTLFAYGQLDTAIDQLADGIGDYRQDTFVGAGLGYRIFNSTTSQWSVQAGPGYRVADVVGGDDINEAAVSVSSNLFYSLSESVYLTNDTDIIYSEASTTIGNDLAISVALTDTLALRTSYATRFNDANDASFSDAANTLGASVVYTFN